MHSLATLLLLAAATGAPVAREDGVRETIRPIVALAREDPFLPAATLLEELIEEGLDTTRTLARALDGGDHVDAVTRSVLGRALDGVPPLVLERSAEGTFSQAEKARAHLAALAIISERGRADDLDEVVALAVPYAVPRLPRQLADEVLAAASGVLSRDEDGYYSIKAVFRAAGITVRPLLIRAVGSRSSSLAMSTLIELVRDEPLYTLHCLSQIERVARDLPFDNFPHDTAPVRMALSSTTLEIRRQAALVVGRLGDAEAIPALIDLLDDDNLAVRENAHWSLKALTGLGMRARRAEWEAWRANELRWWESEGVELLADLGARNVADRTRAINALGRHRLFRREISGELERALSDRSASVVRLACSVLADLGAVETVPRLTELLQSDDPAVRRAAHGALVRLTGEHLPPVHSAWARAQ